MLSQHLAFQTFPDWQWKAARFWHARREGAWRQGFMHATALEHRAAALAEAQRFALRMMVWLRAASGRALRAFRHEAATADFPFDEAFRMQLTVGALNRVPGDAQ